MKYLTLCFLFLFLQTALANSVCTNYVKSKVYSEIQKNIDEKIEQFSNSKIIARKADETLSKLITAKSPFVMSWYKDNDFKNKSEDEIGKSWRQYFSRSFILMKYPQNDPAVDTKIENLIDGLLKENLTIGYQQKLEALFETSKKMGIETVIEMKMKEGPLIIKRIQAMKLYWPKKLKLSRNNTMPLDLIEWGIAYDPVPNEINIGLASFIYPNDETYQAVFAHEIGHAFDPCRWGAFFEGPWPFEKVGECLRSEKSVGAKKRDDSKLEEFQKTGQLSSELVAALKANPTCNKLIYPTRGIQADQLPESFADWFSAEVISHSKKLDVTKLRLDLCEIKKMSEGSSYPDNQTRQDKIYFSNPKIKSLGKSKFDSGEYCKL